MKALLPQTRPHTPELRQSALLVLAAAVVAVLGLIAAGPGSSDNAGIGLDGHGTRTSIDATAPAPARKSRRSRHSVAMPFFSFSARS